MIKNILILLIAFFISREAAAQGQIRGVLMDSVAGKPVGLATVTVFTAADTGLVTYRLSNPEGEFRVPGLELEKSYRAIITATGFDVYRREFTLTESAPLSFDTIYLDIISKTLDEVLVIAERPPVIVKRDTIEFNATAFKTLPTALVEDLLRKLPGVQVDQEGNITANGRRVNRILVDGKAFFGDDPKMATRNLPANVIDKVQVTEDEDERNRNATGDLTNVGQVINLTLKKGVKKGWFGKIYGGAGSSERYQAGGIANIYRDTLQLSILAFSNNINRSGFSFKEVQELGGFNRSGYNSLMVSSRAGNEGFAINGISFGGMDPGVTRTTGAGFNLNHAPNTRNSLFLQYFLGENRNFTDQTTNSRHFLGEAVYDIFSNLEKNRKGYSHNASAGANLKPDTLTDIRFRAGFSYTGTRESMHSVIRSASNQAGELSLGDGHQFNDFGTGGYNHNFFLTRRFRAKKGRTLMLNQFFNYSINQQDYITESINTFYQPMPSIQEFNQLRRQETPVLSVNTHLNYAEPLNEKLTLRFNNRYEYLHDEQDVRIFEKNSTSAKYDILNALQSRGFERLQHRVTSTVSVSYKLKQSTVTAGISGLWQEIHNEFLNGHAARKQLFDFLPGVSFTRKQLSAHYSLNVSAPHIYYLNPVPDSTNPFFVRHGNPALRPARRHSLYMYNYSFLQASGTSLNFYFNGSYTNDDVVLSRTIDAGGVQQLYPVNADGSFSFYSGMGYGKEFKMRRKFSFDFRVNPFVNFESKKLIVNGVEGRAVSFTGGPGISMGLNWNDIIEFRPQYRPSFNTVSYSDPFFPDVNAVTHYGEAEVILRWPKKIVWESAVAYRNTQDVTPGLPRENLLWNAAVTLLMLREDKGLLKLTVYDILDRNNGLFRYTSQNQVIDQQTNVLQRYAELSFTYNIRQIGPPKKVGGRERMFLF